MIYETVIPAAVISLFLTLFIIWAIDIETAGGMIFVFLISISTVFAIYIVYCVVLKIYEWNVKRSR